MEKKKTKYDDIMGYEHHVSKTHPQMSLHDRAAQFAPFAALTGHNDAIKETARLTQRRIELSEEEKEKLDAKLSWIFGMEKETTEVSITYFVKDLYKEGGKYITIVGKIKKVNKAERMIIMEDHTKILLKDIYSVDVKNP